MKQLVFKVLVLLSLVSFFNSSYCQYKERETFWDRVFWGGSIGGSAGTIIQLDISPTVGYYITNRWSAGLGGSYQFYKDTRPLYNFQTDIYGGRVFSSFIVIDDLSKVFPVRSNGSSVFLHGEIEVLSLETRVFDRLHKYPRKDRFYIDSYLVGIGLKQQIGRRAFINLSFLWNLNELTYSPYSNPVIRIGFNF
ncbi:MAG: hypothetical protein A2275_08690 [Bacteroidetes bacterium RIFOXYA12_FULL_35_11]|nr:MAG: hypothetical protein A2X01_16810 [Bacteroidetes bacterium GWF2_35_48]OFY82880.1 MAG: hypothetical protein A2275_08690 [Bacteroidetes bacterium RIFOXYA12_FULL_35_11]OFY95065.1 MAG: hypothetical protein A2491_16345 [Bacteroidetes bacterium RIFOXYC12_FULL_35_7]HBX53574.1 hypothetical protein [Bacteroidales bacterium]